MIETNWVDLSLPLGSKAVHALSDPQDTHWAGVVHLAPGGELNTGIATRNDVYILKGNVNESGQPPYGPETFLVRGNTRLVAGEDGAMLFVYHEPAADVADKTLRDDEIKWQQGGAEGMRVAYLLESFHTFMLVSWSIGTHVPFHDHPLGEEIFVLSGELKDQRGSYPAGTWQRLHSGPGHSPYVDTPTVVLLRNGHLS